MGRPGEIVYSDWRYQESAAARLGGKDRGAYRARHSRAASRGRPLRLAELHPNRRNCEDWVEVVRYTDPDSEETVFGVRTVTTGGEELVRFHMDDFAEAVQEYRSASMRMRSRRA